MNYMIPKPIAVKPLTKYRIWVSFEDGTSGEVDLSDVAGKGIFCFWDEGENFHHVYINPETEGISWSEDLEICPETVYRQLKKIEGTTVEETV